MPTSRPLPTAAARLMAYVEAHESTSNNSNQITAMSRMVDGVDTTSPLYVDDVREAAEALNAATHRIAGGHLVQYGIRFPNGDTVWSSATNALLLLDDGSVKELPHVVLSGKLYPEGVEVRLDNVVTGWGTARDRKEFIRQAEEIAAAAHIDTAEYLRGLRIVRRTIIVDTTEPEVLEFLGSDEEEAEQPPSS